MMLGKVMSYMSLEAGHGDQSHGYRAPEDIGKRRSGWFMAGFKLALLACTGALPRNVACGRGNARVATAVAVHGVRVAFTIGFAVVVFRNSTSLWSLVISTLLVSQVGIVVALGLLLDRHAGAEVRACQVAMWQFRFHYRRRASQIPVDRLFDRARADLVLIPSRTTVAQLVAEYSSPTVDLLVFLFACNLVIASMGAAIQRLPALIVLLPVLVLLLCAPVLAALLVACAVARLSREAVVCWVHGALEHAASQSDIDVGLWLKESRRTYVHLHRTMRQMMRDVQRIMAALSLAALVGIVAYIVILYTLVFLNLDLPLPGIVNDVAVIKESLPANTVGITVAYAAALLVVMSYLTRPFVATRDACILLGREPLLHVPLHDVQAMQRLLRTDPCAFTLFTVVVDGSLVTKLALSAVASLAAPVARLAADASK